MTIRNQLLSQAKHNKRSKRVAIEVVGDDGLVSTVEVEIRTPTVGQARLLAQTNEEGGEKAAEALALALIQCCFDPNGAPIFEAGDVPLILDQAANSWVGTLLKEMAELTKDARAAAKN